MSSSAKSASTCVIGGAGFIGSAVVARLLSFGRHVVVVGRSDRPAYLPQEVEYVRNYPGAVPEVIVSVLERVTEVVDLAYATSPSTSFQDPINDILLNVPETVRLFELAATMSHLRKFVWVSSGGTVYGRTAVEPIRETHPTQPLSPYGITKLALEKYAHMYFETRQLPIVCVRPANAYGEGQRPYAGQGFVATAIASMLDGRELTLFGEQGTIRDYLHVEDLAAGIVAVLLHGELGEVYNLGSGQGLTNRQILELLAPLAAAAGVPVHLKSAPERPFDVPANILDCHKLMTTTNWQQTIPITEGLTRTWNWFASSRTIHTSLQNQTAQ